jgi:putative nucleotidyltransferase with HDIG domain
MEKIMYVTGMCDPQTRNHQNRVSVLAAQIGQHMGLTLEQVEDIRVTALVHDIGKVCLPPTFMVKSDDLSCTDRAIVESHPQVGFALLEHSGISKTVMKSVLQHHERINGTGYPKKMKGYEILIEAKVVAVADVVDAMTSHRPYNTSLGIEDAVKEITRYRGIYYDPTAVNACIAIISSTLQHCGANTAMNCFLDQPLYC